MDVNLLNKLSKEEQVKLLQKYLDFQNRLEESEEVAFERAYFEANGFEFKITPITLGEEREFLKDFKYNIVPELQENTEITTEDKIEHLERLCLRRNIAPKIKKRRLYKLNFGDNYSAEMYYSEIPLYGMIKWLEKKVFYKNKPIRFYDLENKYGLSKIEIYNLIDKFCDMSNFPQHLRLKKKYNLPIQM